MPGRELLEPVVLHRRKRISPVPLVKAATRTGLFGATTVRNRLGLPHERDDELPNIRRMTPGLLATVFTEELALLTMSRIRDDACQPDLLRRTRTELEDALALFERHGWLANPRGWHGDPGAPTEFDLRRDRVRNLQYQELTFDSGYEPADGAPGGDRWLTPIENRTLHAYVMEHRGEPRPWLMYLHPYGMGRPMDLIFAGALRYFRAAGFNIIAPVAPLHGPRANLRRSGDGLISTDWIGNLHGMTQAVWDARRCLAWVRERGATSVAVHGMSLGGYTTALLADLEPDLACVVAGVPAATLHRPVEAACSRVRSVQEAMQRHGLLGPDIEALHRVITPTAMPCLVPHAGRYIYAGLADRLSPPQEPLELWRHWERPTILWSPTSHVATLASGKVRRFVRDSVVESTGRPEPVARPA